MCSGALIPRGYVAFAKVGECDQLPRARARRDEVCDPAVRPKYRIKFRPRVPDGDPGLRGIVDQDVSGFNTSHDDQVAVAGRERRAGQLSLAPTDRDRNGKPGGDEGGDVIDALEIRDNTAQSKSTRVRDVEGPVPGSVIGRIEDGTGNGRNVSFAPVKAEQHRESGTYCESSGTSSAAAYVTAGARPRGGVETATASRAACEVTTICVKVTSLRTTSVAIRVCASLPSSERRSSGVHRT